MVLVSNKTENVSCISNDLGIEEDIVIARAHRNKRTKKMKEKQEQ